MRSLFRPRPVTVPPDPSSEVARVGERIDEVDPEVRAFVPEPGRRERLEREARLVAARWPQATS